MIGFSYIIYVILYNIWESKEGYVYNFQIIIIIKYFL